MPRPELPKHEEPGEDIQVSARRGDRPITPQRHHEDRTPCVRFSWYRASPPAQPPRTSILPVAAHVTAPCHSLSQLPSRPQDRLSEPVVSRRVRRSHAPLGEQPLVHHRLEVPLERPPVRPGGTAPSPPRRGAGRASATPWAGWRARSPRRRAAGGRARGRSPRGAACGSRPAACRPRRWRLADAGRVSGAGVGAVLEQRALDRLLEGALGDLGAHARSSESLGESASLRPSTNRARSRRSIS